MDVYISKDKHLYSKGMKMKRLIFLIVMIGVLLSSCTTNGIKEPTANQGEQLFWATHPGLASRGLDHLPQPASGGEIVSTGAGQILASSQGSTGGAAMFGLGLASQIISSGSLLLNRSKPSVQGACPVRVAGSPKEAKELFASRLEETVLEVLGESLEVKKETNAKTIFSMQACGCELWVGKGIVYPVERDDYYIFGRLSAPWLGFKRDGEWINPFNTSEEIDAFYASVGKALLEQDILTTIYVQPLNEDPYKLVVDGIVFIGKG
jgi:hypothetical protein